MPSTYTIRYATPLCFARTMVRNGQHGVHFTCFRPLRYYAPTNEWQCGGCGGLIRRRARRRSPIRLVSPTKTRADDPRSSGRVAARRRGQTK